MFSIEVEKWGSREWVWESLGFVRVGWIEGGLREGFVREFGFFDLDFSWKRRGGGDFVGINLGIGEVMGNVEGCFGIVVFGFEEEELRGRFVVRIDLGVREV